METTNQQNTPKQGVLDLEIEVQKDVNGIEMGILENGISYLTQNGLAAFSGVAKSVIYAIATEWETKLTDNIIGKDRNSYFKKYLFEKGFKEPKLYIEITKDGTKPITLTLILYAWQLLNTLLLNHAIKMKSHCKILETLPAMACSVSSTTL